MGVILVAVLSALSFVQLQGFNPSDDGVILAQSFRILNGQIPHVDFIAIRPAFSAYLHTLDFMLSGALVPNSRWVVVVEHLIIACTFSFIWVDGMKAWSPGFKRVIFVSSSLLLFWMSGIRILPFPWTTIDAILFSSVGMVFYYRYQKDAKNIWRNAGLSLLFFALAALSRQTFAIVFAVVSLLILIDLLRNRNYKALLFIFLIGAAPFLLYSVMLMAFGGLSDFFTQITSQSSFYETGIQKYLDVISQSRFIDLNTIVLVIAIPAYFLIKRERFKVLIITVTNVYFLGLALYLGHQLSIGTPKTASEISFELFWMLVGILLLKAMVSYGNKRVVLGFLFLLIAWVSSISIGVNSPVFAAGFLLMTTIYLALDGIAALRDVSFMKYLELTGIVLASVFLMHRNYRSQQYFNYRDLNDTRLTTELSAFEDFGSIQTNPNTAKYYRELKVILNEQPNIENNFVCVPNNAIVYPLTANQNPMPLDWLQPAEYPGYEDEVNKAFKKLIHDKKTYIIWDKLNSKQMAYGRSDEVHSKYGYADVIKNSCEIIYESEHFYVYRKE